MTSTGQPVLNHGSNTAVIIRYLTNALYSRESSAVQLADLKKKKEKKNTQVDTESLKILSLVLSSARRTSAGTSVPFTLPPI